LLDDSLFHGAGQKLRDAQKPEGPKLSTASASADINGTPRPVVDGSDSGAPRMATGRTLLQSKVVARVSENVCSDLRAALVFASEGGLLSCGTVHGKVLLWDTPICREERLHGRHYAMVQTAAFSGNGKLLASGSDDHDQPIILWDLVMRQPLFTLRGHTDAAVALAFSPDDTRLASAAGSHDPTVRLWNVRSGRLMATFPASESWHCSLA
jgi:WD40 repeat protein